MLRGPRCNMGGANLHSAWHLPTHLTPVSLTRWEYATPQEFADDVRQVFANCRRYNAPDQEVVVMGNTLEVAQS